MATAPRVLTDIEALKAFAHPLRQRMLTRLQQHGPATAAILAGEFAVDRGATSYHLRQLERFGFIEEDLSRSVGRRRFWRAVPQDVRLPPHGPDAEVNLIADEVLRQWYERGQRLLTYFATHREDFGPFARAAMASHGGIVLTAQELTQFGEDYIAFLNRWKRDRDEASEGARHVTVLFYTFPTPDGELAS